MDDARLCVGLSLLGAGGADAATTTTLATVTGQNPVRAYRGVQAWTDYRVADRRWHVLVRVDGQITMPPAIPAGRANLKVDVGPGPDGKPALAYIACTDACRVVVSDLDGGHPRTIPGSRRATSPTIWGKRVAWVRGDATILTSRIGAAAVSRLAGVPSRKCFKPFRAPQRCERPAGGSVDDLELHGSQLALIEGFSLQTGGSWTEVRFESVSGGPQRLIASMHVGEGQQTWIGPSWAGGRLYFYRSCPFACPRQEGAYRYDASTGSYAFASTAISISGFAMDDDGRRAFEVPGLFGGRDDAPEEFPTTLTLTSPLTFRSTRAPIVTSD